MASDMIGCLFMLLTTTADDQVVAALKLMADTNIFAFNVSVCSISIAARGRESDLVRKPAKGQGCAHDIICRSQVLL